MHECNNIYKPKSLVYKSNCSEVPPKELGTFLKQLDTSFSVTSLNLKPLASIIPAIWGLTVQF